VEWSLGESVSFNGSTRRITVNTGVTELSIRDDVYSAWVRWSEREDNARFLPAVRYSGLDPIPGGVTGGTFFLTNGWKLVYDPSLVAVAGVLYSEDYGTAFWTAADMPVYPATVAAVVNTATTVQNVATGTVPTALDVALQVRAELAIELARMDAAISSRLAAAGYIAPILPPDAASVAEAVLAAATATPIQANIKKINDVTITGAGVPGNSMRPL